MAIISLRMYNREIENLVSRGQTDEAVDHCKYILRQFPKHIDTYRLLGKAFLESQRFTEATDILQRVLSVFPDDNYSQIGMSVIREDEGNLDAALWHMERAYECKTTNKTIQEELRRLYGKRDGIEPPKIRNTRGALVRLYEKGGLYSQAIAEARAALAEDPKRVDLEIILARSYHQSGKLPEAIDICNRLVKKLPYCYEANRILSEILPGTARAEDAKIFQQNLNALNPYAAFVSAAALTPDQVLENAVTLEKLEWQPAPSSESQPEWARSVGVQLQQDHDQSVPDWLAPAAAAFTIDAVIHPDTSSLDNENTPEETALVDQLSQPEDELIPEWMKAAGWQSSTGALEESSKVNNLATDDLFTLDNPQGDDELTPSELPEWLKGIAPSNLDSTPEKEEDLDFLNSILPAKSEDENSMPPIVPIVGSLAAIEWLRQDKEPEPTSTGGESAYPLSQDISENQITMVQPPDSNLSTVDESESAASGSVSDAPSDDVPEWLTVIEENDATVDPLHDANAPNPETLEEPSQEGMGGTAENISKQNVEEDSGIPTVVVGAAAAIAAKAIFSQDDKAQDSTQLIEELEMVAPAVIPSQLVDNVDETISPEIAGEENKPLVSELSEPQSTILIQDTPMPGVPAADDMDAALAWLEMLALKQGADEETLTVAPEDRLETPPEWVKEETTQAEKEQANDQSSSLADKIALGAVGATIINQSPDIEPTNAAETVESGISTEASDIIGGNEMDQAYAWLETLAARQGADEDSLLLNPDERPDAPPDWVFESDNEKQSDGVVADQPPKESSGQEDHQAPFGAIATGIIASEVLKATDEEDRTESPVILPSQTAEYEPAVISFEHIPAADIENIVEAPQTETLPEVVDRHTEPTLDIQNGIQEFEPADAITVAATTVIVDDILDSSNVQTPDITEQVNSLETTKPVMAEPVPLDLTGSNNEGEVVYQSAKTQMETGNVSSALDQYNQLIKSGEKLDSIIDDLQQALYRHPIDVSILQSLGDAYLKSDKLQEALDTYTKAEELLR